MIDTKALRSKVLDLAIQGKLTQQLESDGTAEELYQQIQEEKQKLIKEGKIKKEKVLPPVSEEEIPFEIPRNWKWCRLGDLIKIQSGQGLTANQMNGGSIPVYGGNGINGYHNESIIHKPTIVIGRVGVHCGSVHLTESEAWVTDNAFITTYPEHYINLSFFIYSLKFLNLGKAQNATAQPVISGKKINPLPFPLPPLAEQKRIVERVEEIFKLLDIIDEAQKKYSADAEILKSKLITMGIQGKLTKQLDSDGTAEELYQQIQEEKQKLIKEGKIKATLELPTVTDEEKLFDVPVNWKWTHFGNMAYIVRGGSPRPIKQYITNDINGINWIKIGDVEKGGKYIFNTREKIIPEGEKKSRRVYPGDFLLTNSMSFGRPYISKIEGCIHDGWLLIRNLNGFNADYLYYLLSSSYLYAQFCNKAVGATVDNLNIEKVCSALIPLPPLAEQKRIADTLDEVLRVIG